MLGPQTVLLISIHSRTHFQACSKALERNGFNLFAEFEICRRLP